MQRNKRIAEMMRWTELSPEYDTHDFSADYQAFNLYDMDCAKLLQQRIVDDGWCVQIEHCKTAQDKMIFYASVYACGGGRSIHRVSAETEPAVVVELFCKVYDITEEK
jgi:hypothetical protein